MPVKDQILDLPCAQDQLFEIGPHKKLPLQALSMIALLRTGQALDDVPPGLGPRIRILPRGPLSPIPLPAICWLRSALFAGRSHIGAVPPSRVWMIVVALGPHVLPTTI